MRNPAPETENKDNNDEVEDASSEDDSGADNEAGWEEVGDDNMTVASQKGKQKKSKKGCSAIDKVSC